MYSALEKDRHFIIENVSMYLSENWWTTSYSFNFYSKKNNTVQLIPIQRKQKDIFLEEPDNHNISKEIEKDILKGDYHVQEIHYDKKDYAYYQKRKLQFIKYSIYPAVLFSLVFTFAILSILIKL